MYEREGDTALITFQWVVGDTKAQEKNIRELIRSDISYAITIVSRFVALAITFFVADALLPGTDFFVLLWIVLAASLSIWVSIGIEIFYARLLERIQADDPRRVGWNYVFLDASGIVWRTEISEDYTSWLGVIGVVEQEGSLWIKTGAGHGYYLPPRVFSSESEMSDCRTLIQKLREDPLPPQHLGITEELIRH